MSTSKPQTDNDFVERLRAAKVLAILRGDPDPVAAAHRYIGLGVSVIECTLDTPGALDAIAAVANEYGQAVLVGAGTVTTASQVVAVAAVGGRFVVAPGMDAEVVNAAQQVGLSVLPGCLTPTEIGAARALGVETIKLFPAGPLGVDYLRALRGPFSSLTWVPTGGIALGEVETWLAAGATCVGLGSKLADDPANLRRILEEKPS